MESPVKKDNKIGLLEEFMVSQEQIDCPHKNFFLGKEFVRSQSFKKGTLVLGHEHLETHICALIKGKMLLINGTEGEEISAPAIFYATPGKKLGYAIEDSIFLNILFTEETDIKKIESKHIKKSGEVLLDDNKPLADKEAICHGDTLE